MRYHAAFFLVILGCSALLAGCLPTTVIPGFLFHCAAAQYALTPDGQDSPMEVDGAKLLLESSTPWTRKCVRDDLADMPAEMQRAPSVVRVYVENFYDHVLMSSHFGNYSAHCESDRSLCFIASRTFPGLPMHEFAHARTFMLLGDDALRRWNAVALSVPLGKEKLVYAGESYATELPHAPAKGALTSYSAKSEFEDIAEYAECVADFMHERADVFATVDVSDPRYLAKLFLVYDFRMIRPEAYASVYIRLTIRHLALRVHRSH